MSIDVLLSTLSQVIYLFVAGSTLLQWARQRDQTRLDIALVFASLAITFIARDLQGVFPALASLFTVVLSVALLAQPYLLLRVTRYFRPLHPLVQRAALIGLLTAYASFLLIGIAPIPVFVFIIAYIVVVEGYASVLLVQGALTIAGITGKRLRLASAGSGLLALIFLLALVFGLFGLVIEVPPAFQPVFASLTQVLAILSGLSYYFGFAPPRWLRRAWQLSELHNFLRHTSMRLANDPTATFAQLSDVAVRTIGGTTAVIARWHIAQEHLEIEIAGDSPLQAQNLETEPGAISRAWRQRQPLAARVPDDVGPQTADWAKQVGAKALLIVPIISPLRPWGLLIVALKYRPLFGSDDLDLLALITAQSAIALDHAALVDELQAANQSLEGRVAERTVELSKTNRALRTISDCNQVLVRAESETDLLDQICSIIVETGGYRMAWVGLAEYNEERRVNPAAWAGANDGFLQSVTLTWDETERGRIPMGNAIRTGKPHVAHIAADDVYKPWRDEALRRGYAACIALPLMTGSGVFGGLGIFAAEQDAFDADEVKLLTELADDLAFGITALRTRKAHIQAEDALRRSEEILRKTNRMARVGGWELDLNTMTPYWSEETYRIHEVDPSVQPDLENAINFYAPEARPVINEAVQKAIAEGASYDLELPFITATGKRLWVRAYGQAEFHDGKCIRLSGTFQDITDRKQAEAAILQGRARLAGVIDSAMDAIISVNADQRIVLFNAAAERMFQCPVAEAIDQPLDRFIPERFRANHRRHIQVFGGTGTTNRRMGALGDLRGLRASGEEFPIEASISQVDDAGERQFTVILRDITERMRAEEALHASEQKFSILFEKAAFAAVLSSLPDGVIVDVNEAFEKGFGYTKQEAVGKTSLDLNINPDAEGRARILADLQGLGSAHDMELVLQTKSHGARVFLVNIDLVNISREKYILQTAQDITDRKLAEAQLRDTLVKLERNNRELQDFAYVASHDLQEPLRKIQAFGDRLVANSRDKLDEKGRDYLERMRSAAERMQTLINDLLIFSRVTTKAQPFAPTDLNQVVEGVLSDLEVRIERSGGRVLVEDLPTIDVDPTQMRQILQNLIGNALKFHKPDVVPLVKVTATRLADRSPEEIQLSIEDNGIGFDEKYLDRIFTPFQRLHGRGEYEGTGIGLAVVRKIVERHGGTVTALSQPGEGATFFVNLPVMH